MRSRSTKIISNQNCRNLEKNFPSEAKFFPCYFMDLISFFAQIEIAHLTDVGLSEEAVFHQSAYDADEKEKSHLEAVLMKECTLQKRPRLSVVFCSDSIIFCLRVHYRIWHPFIQRACRRYTKYCSIQQSIVTAADTTTKRSDREKTP